MTLFLQRVLDGLSSGSTYAALGLALVLVFRSTRLLNLAQGEMAMFGAYVAWWFCASAGGPGWPLGFAIAASLAISFVGGAVIERVLVRPIEGSSNHLQSVVVVVALFVAINAITAWMFGTEAQRMPDVFPVGTFELAGVVVPWSAIGLLAVLAVLSVLLWLLLQRTRIGLAMRSVASNPESSSLAGVPVSRLLMLGWGLAAAVGSLAAILVAPRLYLSTTMMQGVLLYAFLAVAIGGFDSFLGAIVGGLTVGVLESLVGGYVGFIGSNLKLSFGVVVLIVFLLVRPWGLFGSPQVARE
jgi:branched-chain amino acid transport system permease protein